MRLSYSFKAGRLQPQPHEQLCGVDLRCLLMGIPLRQPEAIGKDDQRILVTGFGLTPSTNSVFI
ncbi:hypothetical protein I7I53_02849 [Histoplasma capsulatum var. duboisii H88]|nr:hypothetical protein I7I52_08950 [Histoplasma capsulatum]QSS55075.1 hypothetical protein I7I53_02849 [Histoplasma capsulatum var. duboisii H88]QSS73161.1 hypothetical protein I7I50_01223 [Histoplasma capsulatum G186AR]